ncbi:MAG: Uma2 family endonuclease [Chloroflexi bacterium]|nr:Uma2 family endonuclease [Chloroflexota bacterium]
MTIANVQYQPIEGTRQKPDNKEERPPLNMGDRLSRAEFERRYHQYPEIKKAELIEGVVYMPSPIRLDQHGTPHFDLISWLGMYRATTLGVQGADNTTVRLDFENEVQPDILLRLERGSSDKTEDDYLEGPPELIVEIAASSAAYDMYDKKRIYGRNGVQEYLVVQMYEHKIDWFALREGIYESLPMDQEGIICSDVFPGLWLNVTAFWANDLSQMLETLQAGLASPEHTTFTQSLVKK